MRKFLLTETQQAICFEIIEGEPVFTPCFKRPDVYPEAYDTALTAAFEPGRWVITSCGPTDFREGGAFTYIALQEKHRMLIPYSCDSCGEAIATIFAIIHDAENTGDLKVGRMEVTHNADDLFGLLVTVTDSNQKLYFFAEKIAERQDEDSHNALVYSCGQSIMSACDLLNGTPIVSCDDYRGFCCRICDPSDANPYAQNCPGRKACMTAAECCQETTVVEASYEP